MASKKKAAAKREPKPPGWMRGRDYSHKALDRRLDDLAIDYEIKALFERDERATEIADILQAIRISKARGAPKWIAQTASTARAALRKPSPQAARAAALDLLIDVVWRCQSGAGLEVEHAARALVQALILGVPRYMDVRELAPDLPSAASLHEPHMHNHAAIDGYVTRVAQRWYYVLEREREPEVDTMVRVALEALGYPKNKARNLFGYRIKRVKR